MKEAIQNFYKQFDYVPQIENEDKLKEYDNYIFCGMGGSHLSTGMIKMFRPGIDLYVHRTYGLPAFKKEFFEKSLLIASSYSGNTEEVVDFLIEGYSRGYDVSVISTGGKLIDFAKENNLPYIKLPEDGIQPRSALGYSTIALSKMMNEKDSLLKLSETKDVLNTEEAEKQGKDIADSIGVKIPVIYSSNVNLPLAYNWKIKMNETGKRPAFYNLFPELNHNEINSYDKENSEDFHFIFLKDKNDHERIQKRMEVTEEIYQNHGFNVTSIELTGDETYSKIFNNLLIADWTSYYLAIQSGKEPEKVEIIEEFKRKIA